MPFKKKDTAISATSAEKKSYLNHANPDKPLKEHPVPEGKSMPPTEYTAHEIRDSNTNRGN